jgi:hypothetical protein
MFSTTNEQDNTFVASKFQRQLPDAQVPYNPKTQNQMKFTFDRNIGFVDFSSTQLRGVITMSGRGMPRPQNGLHSLFRNVRITSSTGVEMENMGDYSATVNSYLDSTENSSMQNKRDLFGLRSVNKNIKSQLLYGVPGDWSIGTITETHARHPIKFQETVHTGILSEQKVFPVIGSGLNVEITLDAVGRSLVYPMTSGTQTFPVLSAIDVLGSTGGSDALKHIKVGLADAYKFQVAGVDVTNNPFDIGDRLYMTQPDNSLEVSLGVVTAFEINGGQLLISTIQDVALATPFGGGAGVDYLVGSKIFYKGSDRLNGVSVVLVPAPQIAAALVPTSYVLNDMEFSVLQTTPPPAYVTAISKAIASEKGINIDVKTWQVYRHNMTSLAGDTSQLIPATQTRALSTICIPLVSAWQNDITQNSLSPLLDGAQNYQYIYGSKQYPNRELSVKRFAQQYTEPLSMNEWQKAIINSGFMVRNLVNLNENSFSFNRAWSAQGQIKDLSDETLSLQISYEGAVHQKLFVNLVRHIRRINISKNGVRIMD